MGGRTWELLFLPGRRLAGWAASRSEAGLWESLAVRRGLSEGVKVVRFRYCIACRPEWVSRTRESEPWVGLVSLCRVGQFQGSNGALGIKPLCLSYSLTCVVWGSRKLYTSASRRE